MKTFLKIKCILCWNDIDFFELWKLKEATSEFLDSFAHHSYL